MEFKPFIPGSPGGSRKKKKKVLVVVAIYVVSDLASFKVMYLRVGIYRGIYMLMDTSFF